MCWVYIAVFIFLVLIGIILFWLAWRGTIKEKFLKIAAYVAGVVAALAAIAVIVLPSPALSICPETITPPVSTLASSHPLSITKPTNGDQVGPTEEVQGTTAYPLLNHYLVVKPDNGSAYVQAQVNIDSNDSWKGNARFGDVQTGVGHKFTIYLIAAQAQLSPGVLITPPVSAHYSNSVTVTRVK